jgi:glycine cleavage system regulatory protein
MPTPPNSVRVQIRPESRKKLDEIALQFSCTYNNKPSLTELLSEIANGNIQLTSSTSSQAQKKRDGFILQLTIFVPFYFVGIIHLVTKAISESKGNIIELETHRSTNQNEVIEVGVMNILVQVNNIEDVQSLLNNIYNIKLKSLKELKLNPDKSIDKLEESYIFVLKQHHVSEEEINIDNKRLIIEIRCTIGVTAEVNNTPGVASRLTEILADRGILISSMRVRQNQFDRNISSMDLHLFFHPFSASEAEQKLASIEHVKEEIKGDKIDGKEYVLNVKNLDIALTSKNIY